MSAFTDNEQSYLLEGGLLARIATVGKDGTPHVVPVGFKYNAGLDAIEVGGSNLMKSKKYRDVARSGRAAIVIDEIVTRDPWKTRGLEVRGRAETVEGERPLIRIFPERIISWGIDTQGVGVRNAHSVASS